MPARSSQVSTCGLAPLPSPGYVRVVTGIAAFFYALDPDEYQIAGALYTFSYALDALDGVAARKLNQCACSMQHPFSLSVL